MNDQLGYKRKKKNRKPVLLVIIILTFLTGYLLGTSTLQIYTELKQCQQKTKQ